MADTSYSNQDGQWNSLSIKELNSLLPDFEVISLLGQGGMGAVYKATQISLNRTVALKILSAQPIPDLQFEERFRREAQSMAQLNHPNIIQIHDFGETSTGLYYFVMEFVEGTDLARLIHQGEFEAGDALTIIPQICGALQFAHDKGFVHRDIKPANILITVDGQIKVCDFGIAKLIDAASGSDSQNGGLTMTGYAVGTPHYVAPEQLNSELNSDQRADIYSLGVMFYEMLTGDVPRGAFAPPSNKVSIDQRLDGVVLKAMQENPDSRYQKVSEISQAIEEILTNPGKRKNRPSFSGSGVRKRSGHIAMVAGVLLAVGAGLTAFFLTSGKKVAVDTDRLIPPENWDGSTPIAEMLLYLGEDLPSHYISKPGNDQILSGESLVRKGRLADSKGGATPRVSHYFQCTDCHNTVREDADLADLSNPAAKLEYAVENGIPLLQASTFAGIVNRESWYNGDYARKYRFSPTVQSARSSLTKAIQLCCEECSQGRTPEKWEVEALLAYFWSLQWTVDDLDPTEGELEDWKNRALSGNDTRELVKDIKSKYAPLSPATFGDMPEDAKQGLPLDGREVDLTTGKQVFTNSCLHCHDPAEGAADTYFRDVESSRAELARKFRNGSKKSAYGHIRLGTHPVDEQRLYMPNYTTERLSDFQIESLRAYLSQ